jgi:hypothetical protein
MNMLKVTAKRTVLLAIALCLGLSTWVTGQEISSRITTRFANPQFNAIEKTYALDVEMRANIPGQKLFGMNLRLFYDASELEFTAISELHSSYAVQGAAPQALRGNDASGSAMFHFEAAAAYLNTAVQLTKEDAPMEISDNQWTKLGKLNFKIPESVSSGTTLCPTVIWDQKSSVQKQGFFPGSGGVVITLVDTDPTTREVSKPASVAVIPFNWELSGAESMPFGYPINQACVTVGSVSSIKDLAEGAGYALYQNYPNPFANSTVIEFVLPTAQEARLVFCDVSGKILHTIQGDYKAGYNAVKIERSAWPSQGAMIFYRLETAEYTSKALKMTVVDR